MISIFYVTFSCEDEAKKICNTLVKEKLVSCSNIFSIKSSFFWKNTFEEGNEYVGILKSRVDDEQKEIIINRIKELHPYEVPCILHFKVEGNKEYETWINNNSS